MNSRIEHENCMNSESSTEFINCPRFPEKTRDIHEKIPIYTDYAREMFRIFFNDFIIRYHDSKVVAIFKNLKQYDSLGVIDWHVRTYYPEKDTEFF